MKLYKIRNKEGKFSKGGVPNSYSNYSGMWSKEGKTWNLRSLKSHLAQYRDTADTYHGHKNKWPYDNCELVQYELIETDIISMDKLK